MDPTNIDALQEPLVAQKFSLKRILLISLIASLSISALVAIFVFLFGDFGETEIKILFITLTIGGYSLTGVCSSVLQDKGKYISLVYSGIAVSVLGFLLTAGAIWEAVDIENLWQLIIVLVILAVTIAQISLLLLAESAKGLMNTILLTTIIFISIVAMMLVWLVVVEYDGVGEFYFRLLGVFAVLDVLGTIVTLILRKIKS